MSAKKRELADFNDFSSKSEDEQKIDEEKSTSDTEEKEGQVLLNSDNEESTKTEVSNTPKEKGFLSVFTAKKKPTVEETHTRRTWLVRNELIEELEKLSAGQDRGFQTSLVNYAIEKAIEELKRNTEQ